MLRPLAFSLAVLTACVPSMSHAYYFLTDSSSEIVGEVVCSTFEAARQWDTAYERWENRNYTGETSKHERQRMIHEGHCFFGIFKIESVDRSEQCMKIVKVRAVAIRQVADDDIRTHVQTKWPMLVEVAQQLDRGEEIAKELVYIPFWNTGVGVDPAQDTCSK